MSYFVRVCFVSLLWVFLANSEAQIASSITPENIENLSIVRTLGMGNSQLITHPNGQLLGFLSEDEINSQNSIVLWDIDSYQQVNTIQIPETLISRFTFHPDGASIFIGTTTGMILIWDIEQARVIAEWQAYQSAISMLQIHPNRDILVTGNEANIDIVGEIIWWDIQVSPPTEIERYSPQIGGTPTSGLFFGDRDWFVAGIGLRTYLWNISTQQPSNILTGQLYFINDMEYIPNIDRLALISETRMMLWNTEDLISRDIYRYETVIASTNPHEEYTLTSIDATADGQLLITGDSQGILKIWRIDTLELLTSMQVYDDNAIGMVRINANNDTLFIVGQETDEVQVWRIE